METTVFTITTSNMKYTKTFPIYAGMKFTYPGTINNKLAIVGYYTVEFIYSGDGQLISEKQIKRWFI